MPLRRGGYGIYLTRLCRNSVEIWTIDTAKVIEMLPTGNKPETESQARELTPRWAATIPKLPAKCWPKSRRKRAKRSPLAKKGRLHTIFPPAGGLYRQFGGTSRPALRHVVFVREEVQPTKQERTHRCVEGGAG